MDKGLIWSTGRHEADHREANESGHAGRNRGREGRGRYNLSGGERGSPEIGRTPAFIAFLAALVRHTSRHGC
jgi:hypothetical protein